eukprot:366562-Chlamydomonas_euryale.AAC.14
MQRRDAPRRCVFIAHCRPQVGHVEDILYGLQQRSGGGRSPGPSPMHNGGGGEHANGHAHSPASPGGSPHRAPPPRSFRQADKQEAEEVRVHQQMQASHIFKAQMKQYDQAYLNKLEEYIVSVVQSRGGRQPEKCLGLTRTAGAAPGAHGTATRASGLHKDSRRSPWGPWDSHKSFWASQGQPEEPLGPMGQPQELLGFTRTAGGAPGAAHA